MCKCVNLQPNAIPLIETNTNKPYLSSGFSSFYCSCKNLSKKNESGLDLVKRDFYSKGLLKEEEKDYCNREKGTIAMG